MSSLERQRELLHLFRHVAFPIRAAVDGRQFDRENPDLKRLGKLSKREAFSTFNPQHMEEAKELYTMLLGAREFNEFLNLALAAREILNECLFVFGVSWAVLDCSLCEGLQIPPIHEIFPDRFMPSDTITRAIKLYLDRTNDNPLIVSVDETGSPQNEEHRLSYFREDLGLNSHHWHWHLVYPINGQSKDRKGEIFYYMHQQMCARYDCERLSVGLKRVKAIYDFHEPLIGYSPHLVALDSGKSHGSRPDEMCIEETNHMVRWRERIIEAIHQNYLVDRKGNRIPLDAESGINILGAVVEASSDSIYREYYGNLHNTIHNSIARIHDPNRKFQELDGVIGNSVTAVRDPVFFRLHRFVDDLFTEHKITLRSYTKEELNFPGIEVKEFILDSEESSVIFTYMRKAAMELSHAIRMKISVQVEYEHLDHNPFVYNIEVSNTTNINKDATVRIFMAPKYDEVGKDFPLGIQRRYFIEMDKFKIILVPGENRIVRNSTDSTLTVKHIPSFRELQTNPTIFDTDGRNITDAYCSCGWPQHLLVPRGTYRGMDFKLFVMLTDHNEDRVVNTQTSSPKCSEGASYCGIKNQKYPDKKAMGFPFDRTITRSAAEFVTPNMKFTDIKVQFTGLKLILGKSSD